MPDTMLPEPANAPLAGIIEADIPLTVSYYPQTLGWKLLVTVFSFYLALRMCRVVKTAYQNRYRRLVLAKFSQIKQKVQSGDLQAMSQIPELLKATAIHAFGRDTVASLYGRDWEMFLDKHYPGPSFSERLPGQLQQLAYGDEVTCVDAQNELLDMVAMWLKEH